MLFCLINDSTLKIYEPFKIFAFFSGRDISQLKGRKTVSIALHQVIRLMAESRNKVQRWVLTRHIIPHRELKFKEGVLANPHSRTKDIGKSWMNFDKSCVYLLLEVLKGWANPFDHRESLIHISSCIEASHTTQNDLLYAEKVGLEELKRFWAEHFKSSEKSFYSPLKKATCSHSNTWL